MDVCERKVTYEELVVCNMGRMGSQVLPDEDRGVVHNE